LAEIIEGLVGDGEAAAEVLEITGMPLERVRLCSEAV
jgi:hypothetical protein